LLNPESRRALDVRNRREQAQLVESHRQRQTVHLVPYRDAVARRFKTDWATVRIDVPSFLGCRVLENHPLASIAEYIDWSPYFMAWEMKGKISGHFFRPRGRRRGPAAVGRCPAAFAANHSRFSADGARRVRLLAREFRGDDILVFTDESRSKELARFHTLRQQWERKGHRLFWPWPISSLRAIAAARIIWERSP